MFQMILSRSSRLIVAALLVIVALLAAAVVAVASAAPAKADAADGSGGLYVQASGRLLSTVTNNDTLHAGTWLSIPVEGQVGIPATGVSAVQVSLDAVNVVSAGSLYADPDGTNNRATTMPYLNYSASAQSNTATLALGSNGAIQVEATSTTDLIVDVEGYYTSGTTAAGGYVPIQQTRLNTVPVDTVYNAGQSVTFNVGTPSSPTAPYLVPSGASAVMLDVLEYHQDSTANGWLTVEPAGSSAGSGQMNWPAGKDYAWSTVVPLPTNGSGNVTIAIGPRGSVKLAVSVEGYYTATTGVSPTPGMFTPAQANVADTRSPANPIAGSGTRTFQVAGVGGVPAVGTGISSVAVEVELYPTASGQEVTYADDQNPDLEQQAFTANTPITSFSVIKLGADGGIKMNNNSSGNLNVALHVEGWFSGLPTGPATTGITGSRPSATNLPFPIDDQTSAQVDVATGNLEVATNAITLPGVKSSASVGATYNSMGWQSASDPSAAGNHWGYGLDSAGSLSANGTSVIYTGADGTTWPMGAAGTGGVFTSPAGLSATLTRVGGEYQLKGWTSNDTVHFDLNGKPTSITDNAKTPNTVNITWDGADLTGIVGSAGPSAARTLSVAEASSTDTFTQTNGSSTRSFSYSRDSSGNLTTYTDATGKTTTFAYSGTNLTSITAPTGGVTNFTYDPSGRVIEVDVHNTTSGSPGTATTRLSYVSSTETDVAGPNTDTSQPVSAVNPTKYTGINASHQVGTATDPDGNVQSASYNGANGAIANSTVGAGAAATKTTDSWSGNSATASNVSLTQVQSSSGTSSGAASTATYGNSGSAAYLPSQTTDGSGNTTTLNYNTQGDLAGSSVNGSGSGQAPSPANATLQYNDGTNGTGTDGTLASATSPTNQASKNATTYTYDANHQLSTVTAPTLAANTGTQLGVKTDTYDAYGRLASQTDGNGHTTSFTYDNDDRQLTESFSDGTQTVTNTYDGNGNELTSASAGGTITNTYDQQNRLLTTRNTAGGGTLQYTYDKASNELTSTDAKGTITYTYDAANVLWSMTYPHDSGTETDRYAIDNHGRRTDSYVNAGAWPAAVTNAVVATTNGTPAYTPSTYTGHTQIAYDAASGHLSEIKSWTGKDASKVYDTTYSYLNGSVQSNQLQTATDNLTGKVTHYGYVAGGFTTTHLTGVTQTGGNDPSSNVNWAFSYDANGNRLTANETNATSGANLFSQSLSYNVNNQIDTAGYTYDAAGNMTASPGATYTYNGAEQLVTIDAAGTHTTLKYMGASQDQLISALADSTASSYVYGKSGIDTDTVAGTTSRVLTSPDGQVLNLTDSNGDSAAFIVDGIGNQVGALTDIGTGSDAFTVSYDPYGTGTASSGSSSPFWTQDPFGFKVGVQTSEYQNGIIRYGLRWYLPAIGGWTQEDTLDAPLDPSNADRYAYAGSDPVNNSDASGNAIGTGPGTGSGYCSSSVDCYSTPGGGTAYGTGPHETRRQVLQADACFLNLAFGEIGVLRGGVAFAAGAALRKVIGETAFQSVGFGSTLLGCAGLP